MEQQVESSDLNNHIRHDFLEQISYENMIHFYKNELIHVLDNNQYSGNLTKREQARLYRYGITFCKSRGSNLGGASVMLTNKALKILEREIY
jgi:hypothetical protein